MAKIYELLQVTFTAEELHYFKAKIHLDTEIKRLQVDRLIEIGFLFLNKEYKNKNLPGINIVLFAWQKILELAESKKINIFD